MTDFSLSIFEGMTTLGSTTQIPSRATIPPGAAASLAALRELLSLAQANGPNGPDTGQIYYNASRIAQYMGGDENQRAIAANELIPQIYQALGAYRRDPCPAGTVPVWGPEGPPMRSLTFIDENGNAGSIGVVAPGLPVRCDEAFSMNNYYDHANLTTDQIQRLDARQQREIAWQREQMGLPPLVFGPPDPRFGCPPGMVQSAATGQCVPVGSVGTQGVEDAGFMFPAVAADDIAARAGAVSGRILQDLQTATGISQPAADGEPRALPFGLSPLALLAIAGVGLFLFSQR